MPVAPRARRSPVRGSAPALALRPARLGLFARLARLVRALVSEPGRARRRGRQEKRIRVLARVAVRPGTPAETRRFLEAALARQARIVELLATLGVAEDLFLDWREGVLGVLEREAARARRLERVRERLRGPLPTSVVEERLVASVAAGRSGNEAEARHAREELMADLDRLLGELEAPGNAPVEV